MQASVSQQSVVSLPVMTVDDDCHSSLILERGAELAMGEYAASWGCCGHICKLTHVMQAHPCYSPGHELSLDKQVKALHLQLAAPVSGAGSSKYQSGAQV